MSEATQLRDPEIAPADVAQLVSALLDGIERGELAASSKEVDFLRSVATMLRVETPA